MALRLKRVYDDPDETDGFRVLVDRLWPRGVTKERAAVDLWLKDIAPSAELRTEWHHSDDRFDEFADRYRGELAQNPAVAQLRELIAAQPTVTLLYGSKDRNANHALVLKDFLESA